MESEFHEAHAKVKTLGGKYLVDFPWTPYVLNVSTHRLSLVHRGLAQAHRGHRSIGQATRPCRLHMLMESWYYWTLRHALTLGGYTFGHTTCLNRLL